jgi:DNA repair protein RadC
MPERTRPREEVERLGVGNVRDAVLLAILLRCGVKGRNVADLAEEMLRRYGSLTALAASSVEDLSREFKGIGKVKAQTLLASLEIGRRLTQEAVPRRCKIRTPEDAAQLLRESARPLNAEVFWVLLLDARNQLKRQPVEISRGLLDSSQVHPREVFREAVRTSTAAVVLVHNHPSGDPTPSAEDVRITRQLVEAGRVMGINVLDHVVLGRSTGERPRDYLSLREEGLVSFSSN